MKKNRVYLLGVLALLLTFGAVFAACGKKDSGGGSSGGGGSAPAGGSAPVDGSAEEGGSSPAKVVSGGKAAKETDFVYELNEAGDGVVITGYQKDAAGGDLVIPATIEGYPVTAVVYGGNSSPFDVNYYDRELKRYLTAVEIKAKGLRPAITSVVFPDSVTEIRTTSRYGASFISGNPYLTSISFPKDLKEIPDFFAPSNSALTAVKWPETLEIIGVHAFSGAGFTELVLPEGVREIQANAFSEYKNLTTVTIPASIEKIGNDAFFACPVLATVNMPAKTIQYQWYINGEWYETQTVCDVFSQCPKLTGIAARKTITDTGYTGGF
jgi:hypothetical protein